MNGMTAGGIVGVALLTLAFASWGAWGLLATPPVFLLMVVVIGLVDRGVSR